MKILIVDFDEESILALSEYLKSEGFNVSVAEDGEVGLEKCKSEYPDLVIVEPMISKLHGFELCSIISHDFNGQIPVVILTKFYREEQFKIEATSAYGASAFLSKPFKGPEILSTIKDLLKEKIKENEEKDMAEETQNLEEFSEKALENIKIDAKATEAKLQADDLENEILEPVPPAKNVTEKEEKSPNIKTQIDKMLEDTLSEFGLNLEEKAPPKSEEKSVAPPEEKIETVAEEKVVAKKESVKEKEVVEKKEVMEEKKDKIFTAMEEEDKPKISPLVTSKSYMEYLKKLPLKFIIPLILVAAVALSASFIFHKSTSTNTTPQNMTSAIQPAKNKTDIEPEEIVIEKATQEEQPQVNPPAQEPSTESPTQEPIETEGEVKTKVNEVFAVKEIQPQIPDVENVNLEEDVLSETAESTPEPILPQELPAKPPEDNPESANLPSGDSDTELTPLGIPGSTPEEDQPAEESQTSDDEIPVETGDLIPFRKVDIKPEIAKKVDPEYPILAYNRGVEGKVVINVLISETGDVIETALIKGIVGPYGFNEECDNAVRQWKFVPAFKDGVKVKVWKTISFTFKKS